MYSSCGLRRNEGTMLSPAKFFAPRRCWLGAARLLRPEKNNCGLGANRNHAEEANETRFLVKRVRGEGSTEFRCS